MSRSELLEVASGIATLAIMAAAGWVWWVITP